ncbi:hypothetical protein ACEF17_12575, partial [Streptococcus hyovaginalis]
LADLYEKADQVQLSVEIADSQTVESLLADKSTVAFYNPTNLQEDRQSRELATRNRIITFTQKESLEAFISSFKGKDITVHSIQEWHTNIRKGVSTV